ASTRGGFWRSRETAWTGKSESLGSALCRNFCGHRSRMSDRHRVRMWRWYLTPLEVAWSYSEGRGVAPRRCSMIPGCGLWTSDIADQHVCGSRMTIVPLRFDERVIYQKRRALQILSLAGIAGERPSIHSSEQVTRRRIAHGGFRYVKGDRAVCVEAGSRHGPYLRFPRGAKNQTHDSCRHCPL